MAVIEIEERIAAALRAQATVRDLSLDAFLQRIAESVLGRDSHSADAGG